MSKLMGENPMLSLLLVEDEKLEREGIRFLLDKYGFHFQVQEAENGEQALAAIRTNPVDILLTDIEMPFLNGLELAKKVRVEFPKTQIIIYSAYSDFNYAVDAISVNVIHYILKPIDPQEFKSVIDTALDRIHRAKVQETEVERLRSGYEKAVQYELEELWLGLLYGKISSDAARHQMRTLILDWKAKPHRLILIDMANKFFMRSEEDFVAMLTECFPKVFEYVNLNEEQALLIWNAQTPIETLQARSQAELLHQKLQESFDESAVLVVSEKRFGLEGVSRDFADMEAALERRFFYIKDIILLEEEGAASQAIIAKAVDIATQNLRLYAKDNLFLSNEMAQLALHLEQDEISTTYVMYLCAEMLKSACRETGTDMGDAFVPILERIFSSRTVAQLESVLAEGLAAIPEMRKNYNSSLRKAIHDAEQFIEQNYMRDCSLEDVAGHVYLSPNYLSHLFKQEKGVGFKKYMQDIRLGKAALLIKSTNQKINCIAVQIGYTSIPYFWTAFKKHFGVSPAQYRQIGGGDAVD
jgi:two-component system response regulator YesN